MFSLSEIEAAHRLVTRAVPPTPQYAWPQLGARAGAKVWVKHENHTPTGSFKVRGACTFVDWLVRTQPESPGIITATRGNHGQGQARAATVAGRRAVIYMPHGNSIEKNAAMKSFGAELVEYGHDFDEAKEEVLRVAEEEGLTFVPPFHKELVRGVSTYAYELLTAVPDLDTLYVPVGCGSGICGCIARPRRSWARHADRGRRQRARPNSQALGRGPGIRWKPTPPAPLPTGWRFVSPWKRHSRSMVQVQSASSLSAKPKSPKQFVSTTATSTISPKARALASLAALLNERDQMAGRKVAVILTGGNIDTDWFLTVMSGGVPVP